MSTLTQFFGGGGVPIGSLVDIPDFAPNVYESGGQTFLRSGVTAPSTTYPQVPSTLLGDVYENEQISNSNIGDHAISEFIGTTTQSVNDALRMELASDGVSKIICTFIQWNSTQKSQYNVRYYLLSTDQGVTWKRYLLPNLEDSYRSIQMVYVSSCTYFNGKFYIFYSNGTYRTSTDGISWVLVSDAGIDFDPVKTKVVNGRLFVFPFRWYAITASGSTQASAGGYGQTATSQFYYTQDGNTWTKNTAIANQPHDVTFDGTNYYFINTAARAVYKAAATQGNPASSGYAAVGSTVMTTIANSWTPQGGHWPASIEWDATNNKLFCLYSDYYYASYYGYRGVTLYTSIDGGTNWQRIDIGPYTGQFPVGQYTSFQLNLIGNDVYIPLGYSLLLKIVKSTNAQQTVSLTTTWFEGTPGAGMLIYSPFQTHIKHGTNYLVPRFVPNTSGPSYSIWKFSEQTPYSMTASDELYHRGYASGYTRFVRKSSTEFIITSEPVNQISNTTIPVHAYSSNAGMSYLTQNSPFYHNGSSWLTLRYQYLWDHYLHSTDNGTTITERKMPYKAAWHIGKGQGNVFYAFAGKQNAQQTTMWQLTGATPLAADNRVYTSTDLINWTRVGDLDAAYAVYDVVGTQTATIVYSFNAQSGVFIHTQTNNGNNWTSVRSFAFSTAPATYPSIGLPRPVYDQQNNILGLYYNNFVGSERQFVTQTDDWTQINQTTMSNYSLYSDAIKIGNRHLLTRDSSVVLQEDNWATQSTTLQPTLSEFQANYLLSGVMYYDAANDILFVRIGNRLYLSRDKGSTFFRSDTSQTAYAMSAGSTSLLADARDQVRDHTNDMEKISGDRLIYLQYSGIRSPLTGSYIQNQKYVSGATNTAKYMRVA